MSPRSFAISFFVLLFNCALLAQDPGSLDTGFGDGGKVSVSISGGFDEAHAVVVQPDGKILVAGLAGGAFGVARFLPDGSLDVSFGTGGKVRVEIGITEDAAGALALQADGKILLAGYSKNGINPEQQNPAILRFLSDGTPDTGFGANGRVLLPFQSGDDYGYALELQADGKILMACTRVSPTNDFAVTRLLSSGQPDNSFGTGGTSFTPIGTSEATVNNMALQADGKIILVGAATGSANSDLALVRYRSDGFLDPNFGTGGKVLAGISANADEFGYDIAVQPDGKILALATVYTDNGMNSQWALFRFTTNGDPDSAFGTGGKVVTSEASTAFAEALALQPDGLIVLAGYGPGSGTTFYEFTLARYLANGAPDISFGVNGFVQTGFGTLYASVYDLALQPDGAILAAGATYFQSEGNFAMARYHAGVQVAVAEVGTVPQPTVLVFPNPLQGDQITVRYKLDQKHKVLIRLVDGQGRRLKTLLNANRNAGEQEETLRISTKVPNGVYFIQIQTRHGMETLRLVIAR